jgi:single-strand DNA-binding protein
MAVMMKGPMMLGRDAEVRSTAAGDQVTTLSLAYNYGKKGQDGKKPTQWVDCALWGERGPRMEEWLLKGTTWDVQLEDVRMEEFKKRDGSPGFKMSARVNNIDFITGCNYGNSGGQRQQSDAPRSTAPAPAARAPMRAAPPPTSGGLDDFDDGIPF